MYVFIVKGVDRKSLRIILVVFELYWDKNLFMLYYVEYGIDNVIFRCSGGVGYLFFYWCVYSSLGLIL